MESPRIPKVHVRLWLRLVCVLALLLALGPSAGATSYAWIPIATRVQHADLIVIGRVIAAEENKHRKTERDCGPNESTLLVTQVLLGELDPGEPTIRLRHFERFTAHDGNFFVISRDERYKDEINGIWILKRSRVAGVYCLSYSHSALRLDDLEHVRECIRIRAQGYSGQKSGIEPDARTWVTGWDCLSGVHLQACVHDNGDVSVLGSYRDELLLDGKRVLAAAKAGDHFLARLAPNGRLKWIRTLGDEQRFDARLSAGHDGSCLLTGTMHAPTTVLGTQMPTHKGRPHLIVCVTSDGSVAWAQTLGDFHPRGSAIQFPPVRVSGLSVFAVENGYRVVGSYRGALMVGRRHVFSEGTDWFRATLGMDGFVRHLGRVAQDDIDIARVVDAPGNRMIVGGYIRLPGKGADVYVGALPLRGPERWRVTEGGQWDDFLSDLAVGPDGTVYATMRVTQPSKRVTDDMRLQAGAQSIVLGAWSPDGENLWQADGAGRFVDVGNDGRVYTAGEYQAYFFEEIPRDMPPPAGDQDLFLACFGAGKRLWVRRDGGLGSETPTSLQLLTDGRAVIAGSLGGTSYLAGETVSVRGWRGGFVMNVPLPN